MLRSVHLRKLYTTERSLEEENLAQVLLKNHYNNFLLLAERIITQRQVF